MNNLFKNIFQGGQSLLKSLATLAGSDSDLDEIRETSLDDISAVQRYLTAEECVRPALHGAFSIRIRSANLFNDDDSQTSIQTNNFCKITIRNLKKKSRVVPNVQGTLTWDQIKHFPVTVVRNRRHPFNLIMIQLFCSEAHDVDSEFEIGSLAFHLHDIITASPICGRYDLWKDDVLVGDIGLELTFNYGIFGYGYSSQLQEDDMKPDELTQYSQLPRINPTRDTCEFGRNTMAVTATPHPSFIKFNEEISLSYGKEIVGLLEKVKESMYRPKSLEEEMGDYSKIRDEYLANDDRVARLIFLHSFIEYSENNTEKIHEPNLTPTTSVAEQSEHFPSKTYTRFVKPYIFRAGDTPKSGKFILRSSEY